MGKISFQIENIDFPEHLCKKIERVNEESKSSQIRRHFTWKILMEVKCMEYIRNWLADWQAELKKKIYIYIGRCQTLKEMEESIYQRTKMIFNELEMKASERHLQCKNFS